MHYLIYLNCLTIHVFQFHPSHTISSLVLFCLSKGQVHFPQSLSLCCVPIPTSFSLFFYNTSLRNMGSNSNRSPMLVILIVFTLFTATFALDMSIISYDKTHSDKSSRRSDKEVKTIYEEWRVKHGKLNNNIDGSEKDKRFEIFKDHLKFIDEHNAENRTYKVGLNRFADLSNEEYRSSYLGTKIDPIGMMMARTKTRSNRYAPSVGDKLPKSVDWRSQGAVVQVKDQGSCGNFGSTPISSCLTIVFVYCFFFFLCVVTLSYPLIHVNIFNFVLKLQSISNC